MFFPFPSLSPSFERLLRNPDRSKKELLLLSELFSSCVIPLHPPGPILQGILTGDLVQRDHGRDKQYSPSTGTILLIRITQFQWYCTELGELVLLPPC